MNENDGRHSDRDALENPERGHPSDMPGGNSAVRTSESAAGTRYAGEPGPAEVRGENHMDPLRVDEDADPGKS